MYASASVWGAYTRWWDEGLSFTLPSVHSAVSLIRSMHKRVRPPRATAHLRAVGDVPSILFATTKQGMPLQYSCSSSNQCSRFLYVTFRVTSNTYARDVQHPTPPHGSVREPHAR